MTPEAIADLAIRYARDRAAKAGISFEWGVVESFARAAFDDALHEVRISAPSVVIEDRREHGGAVVSDLRSVQDKANG